MDEQVSYRNFQRPAFGATPHRTGDWMRWIKEQGVLLPVAPPADSCCVSCFGATAYRDSGGTWPQCYTCRSYGDAVDTFVPIAYSVDEGLESMLHRFKDFNGYHWLRRPLAVLLTKFVNRHARCLEEQTPRGRFDVATCVPPNDPRNFNHLDELIEGVVVGDPLKDMWDWDTSFLSRDPSTSKPARRELKPSAYLVDPFVVEGSSVLLLDDTWTSGASAASSAAALKAAGAAHVTVLTLGRQLNPDSGYGSTAEIYDDVHDEPWNPRICVLCS